MSGPLFNIIPGSGLVAPGIHFEVNSGGQYASNSRALIIGHCASAGTLAAATPTICATVEEAAGLCGVGSQLYEMFRIARANAPQAEIWLGRVAITGTAQAWTITVNSVPTAGGDAEIDIAGRHVRISTPAGDAVGDVAADLAAAINAYVDPLTKAYLPVTATAASAVVTLTARHPGTTMNEIEIAVSTALKSNILAGAVTIASSVSGTGTASISAMLAALGDDPFDWIISPFGDDSNVALAETALSDLSGRWAYNVQLYGHYFYPVTGSTSELTTAGLARNSRHTSLLGRTASPTPSYEWIAGYVGRQLTWLTDDTLGNASRNMSDLAIEGVLPPRARTAWPGQVTRNTLLNNGVSTWRVNAVGQTCVDKCITNMRVSAAGLPDSAFRDVQAIAQVMHGLRYLRAGLAQRHGNKAIADANPGNLAALSTPADIKADCIALYGDLVDRGMFENRAEFGRRLQVVRNASNPARVDIGMDMDRVNPLDILAANATIYAQYPRS